jgi:hypothetical protein
MKLERCNAGHYYDSDTFAHCPHCEGGDSSVTVESATVASRPSAPDATVAPTANTGWGHVPQNYNPDVTVPLDRSGATDNDATVGVYVKEDVVIQPVAGWLVCIQGPSLGKDYRLVAGRNSIGRDNSNAVSITEDRSISRAKHAIVTYDPHSNSFFVQPGESSELCYINRTVVLDSMPLNADDILTVGKTGLLFLPCCTGKFSWDLLTNGGASDV